MSDPVGGLFAAERSVTCPLCDAAPTELCTDENFPAGAVETNHSERAAAYLDEEEL